MLQSNDCTLFFLFYHRLSHQSLPRNWIEFHIKDHSLVPFSDLSTRVARLHFYTNELWALNFIYLFTASVSSQRESAASEGCVISSSRLIIKDKAGPQYHDTTVTITGRLLWKIVHARTQWTAILRLTVVLDYSTWPARCQVLSLNCSSQKLITPELGETRGKAQNVGVVLQFCNQTDRSSNECKEHRHGGKKDAVRGCARGRLTSMQTQHPGVEATGEGQNGRGKGGPFAPELTARKNTNRQAYHKTEEQTNP